MVCFDIALEAILTKPHGVKKLFHHVFIDELFLYSYFYDKANHTNLLGAADYPGPPFMLHESQHG